MFECEPSVVPATMRQQARKKELEDTHYALNKAHGARLSAGSQTSWMGVATWYYPTRDFLFPQERSFWVLDLFGGLRLSRCYCVF